MTMGKSWMVDNCKPVGEEVVVAPPSAGRKRKASPTSSSDEVEVVRRRNSVEVDDDDNDVTSNFVDLQEEEIVTDDELEPSTDRLEADMESRETTPLPDEEAEKPEEMLKYSTPTPSPESVKSTPTPSPMATPPPPLHRQITAYAHARRPMTTPPPRRQITAPSEAELDDFFAEANATLQKDFANKYNFDFADEKPLPGRFEWVRVEP